MDINEAISGMLRGAVIGSAIEELLFEKTSRAEMKQKRKQVEALMRQAQKEYSQLVNMSTDLYQAAKGAKALLQKYEKKVHKIKGMDFTLDTSALARFRGEVQALFTIWKKVNKIEDSIAFLHQDAVGLLRQGEKALRGQLKTVHATVHGIPEGWAKSYAEIDARYKTVGKSLRAWYADVNRNAGLGEWGPAVKKAVQEKSRDLSGTVAKLDQLNRKLRDKVIKEYGTAEDLNKKVFKIRQEMTDLLGKCLQDVSVVLGKTNDPATKLSDVYSGLYPAIKFWTRQSPSLQANAEALARVSRRLEDALDGLRYFLDEVEGRG